MKNYRFDRLQSIPPLPQLRDAGPSPWLPLALLLLALSTVFLFAHHDRDTFYRPGGIHNHVTLNFLAVAGNLSPEHRFLGFHHRSLNPDGSLYYETYNRFPIGGYLLIKLFILPFPDDLSAQIYSARILLLLAYAGAALLAYLSLCRLTGHRWIALTAALLAFAAPHWLYYNDMVSNEVGLDFFGVMLTFHGMVIFVQEGRFRQLLLKSCLALLLGWHTYALLLPFILIGLSSELIRAGTAASQPPLCSRIRAALARLFRSRYLTLGIVTFLFGATLLGFNLTNEYSHYRGQNSLTELPTVESVSRRLSLSLSTSPAPFQRSDLFQRDFLSELFHRIGGMSTPYALPPAYLNELDRFSGGDPTGYAIILGIAVTAVAFLGLAFVPHKRLWAALCLCGFCWMLLASGAQSQGQLEYEILFYTGITLAAGSFLLLYLRHPGGHRFIAAGSAAALLAFGLSSFQMSQYPPPRPTTPAARTQQLALADLSSIRSLTQGHTVSHNGDLPEIYRLMKYYFSRVTRAPAALADFIILPLRLDGVESLTPQNKRLFLYPGGPDALPHYLDQILAQSGPPLINAHYAVYHYAGQPHHPDPWLFYVRNQCQPPDQDAKFFLHLVPQNPADLTRDRWPYGFVELDFRFRHYTWSSRGRCIAGRPLPSYPIAQITTGQYDPDTGPIWQGEFTLPPEKPPAQ